MQLAHGKSLLDCNTLGLAASARSLATVATLDELLAALEWAATRKLAVVPLGEGSNVVLGGELDALVLRQLGQGIQILGEEGERVTLRVAAGENWHQLVCWTLQRGFFGLENLALIPGTAGAAPIQNIGAYGVELERFVEQVQAVDILTGASRSFDRGQCQFSYRDSVFKQAERDRLVITSVDLCLSLTPEPVLDYPALAAELGRRELSAPSPRDVFDAVVAIRSARLPDPAREPNAGSFFKNPQLGAATSEELAERFPGLPRYDQADGRVKIPAAWLIDYCGWKGQRRQGVGVHPQHALVLVNYGANDAGALLQLAADIRTSVENTFGISLEMEPRVYGAVT